MENLEFDSLVFIFEGVEFDELVSLREKIFLKHFQCLDHHDQISKQNLTSKIDSNETVKAPKDVVNSNQPEQKEDIFDDISNLNEEDESLIHPTESISMDENFILKCPFQCDEVPETDWSVDTLFAHIFCSHTNDVKNNYYVSIDTFIERLTSKLSSNKCNFKCDKSKNKMIQYDYSDLRALKAHYYRCHVDEPVICDNCGESLKNQSTYYMHSRHCNIRKECNICGDGKTFKSLKGHMRNFHGEKIIQCQEDGCSFTARAFEQLRKHVRTIHKKEKPFVCDKCGIRMAQFHNLQDHRAKVHREKKPSFTEYKTMIRSGQHPYLPADSEIPSYM